MSLHIAIAGGGLLGRLTAWRLLEAGLTVSLYEAGSFSASPAAALTAAGMISPLAELVDSEALIYQMGLHSLTLWPQWLANLNVDNTAPSLLHQNGSIVVAHPNDHAELQYFNRALQYQKVAASAYKMLNQQQIVAMEPALEGFDQGIFLNTEAHIDNQLLMHLVLERIRLLGGRCFEHSPVVDVSAQAISLAEEKISADWHLDCRGVGAKPSTAELRGVRGEVLWVKTKELSLQRPIRLLHPRYKLYVVPKPDHHFIIGATEIESEDRSAISVQSSLELTSALYSINSAFAEANIIKTDVNLRPAYMNNRPKLICNPGYIHANGLYRHGYLLAPAVVDVILEVIIPKPSLIALPDFHSALVTTL